MAESEALPGSGRIHASTEKLTGLVLKKGRIWGTTGSTEKLTGRVSKMGRIRVKNGKWQNPGYYRDPKESVRVPKN